MRVSTLLSLLAIALSLGSTPTAVEAIHEWRMKAEAVPQAQEPPEYPVGVFCSPKGDIVRGRPTTDHPCACKRHDQVDSDDPDAAEKGRMCKAGEATNPSHEPVCKQWCHEQHCQCPIDCDVKGHHHEG